MDQETHFKVGFDYFLVIFILFGAFFNWKYDITRSRDDYDLHLQAEISCCSLYISLIQISWYNSTRIRTSYHSWCKMFGSNYGLSECKIVSTKDLSHIQPDFIRETFSKGSRFYKYSFLMLAGIRDFLKTPLLWYLRTTDDAYVDYNGINQYLHYLESRYDPLKYPVIKGHLINYPYEPYLHGGSGWLMSRYAAQKFIELVDQYPDKTLPFDNRADDIALPSLFFKKINPNISDWASGAFNGSPISPEAISFLNSQNFTNVPTCDGMPIGAVNQFVVWHAGDRSMSVVVNGEKYIRTTPSNIFVMCPKHVSIVCKNWSGRQPPEW